jgi:hypothetical protein
MKHCPTTPRADDPEITGARIATTCQHKDYGESKREKDHLLLSLLSLAFLRFLLAETTFFVNPPQHHQFFNPKSRAAFS